MLLRDVAIERVMRSPVVTIEPRATLRKATTVLKQANIGTLAVMDGSELAGIVSERDVTWALADGADPDEVWVADVMSVEPRYVTSDESAAHARGVMLAAGIRHLPVMEEGQLIGIVSMRDLLGDGRSTIDPADLEELRMLLDGTLGDLSAEIAGTDNASYRHVLHGRREHLQHVRVAIGL